MQDDNCGKQRNAYHHAKVVFVSGTACVFSHIQPNKTLKITEIAISSNNAD